jgi:hypothetical protein
MASLQESKKAAIDSVYADLDTDNRLALANTEWDVYQAIRLVEDEATPLMLEAGWSEEQMTAAWDYLQSKIDPHLKRVWALEDTGTPKDAPAGVNLVQVASTVVSALVVGGGVWWAADRYLL